MAHSSLNNYSCPLYTIFETAMFTEAEWDLVVVGAGLIGVATARGFLARHPGARLAVVEKENAIAQHQSARNSGVIHSGIYYAPGSLKAQLCVEGVKRLTGYCEERGIPFKRCGKLIVATEESELSRLAELLRRGRANSVPGLEIVTSERIREIEPHATGLEAIYSPTTGIVDFGQVAKSLAADVEAAGGALMTGAAVIRIQRESGGWRLETARGKVHAASVITCGGLHADRLAMMTGGSPDPRIVSFRGEFWRLKPERAYLVRSLIYPVPNPAFPFLGVHLNRRMNGEVWLGPNAVLALAREGYRCSSVQLSDLGSWILWPGFWRMAARYWRMGVGELYRGMNRFAFIKAVQQYVPAVQAGDVVRASSGVRAQAVSRAGTLVDDFVFDQEEGILHVRNAPSPAATSCLAIASRIVDRFVGV